MESANSFQEHVLELRYLGVGFASTSPLRICIAAANAIRVLNHTFDLLRLVVVLHALQAHRAIGRSEFELLTSVNFFQRATDAPATPQGFPVEEGEAAQRRGGSKVGNESVLVDPFDAVGRWRHNIQVVIVLLHRLRHNGIQCRMQINIRHQRQRHLNQRDCEH